MGRENLTTFSILATGPSMSQALADALRGKAKVIAVSDAYKLAPWADAMASQDAAWWAEHPEAMRFDGRKFSGAPVDGVEKMEFTGGLISGSNSGLLACHVAVMLGAKRILLCGFDMRGSHYFGPHPEPLKNTTPGRFEVFKKQFAQFRPAGVEILNCTPASGLTCYPVAELKDYF